MTERSAETAQPRYHSRECMDAWMLPCRCGVEQSTPLTSEGEANERADRWRDRHDAVMDRLRAVEALLDKTERDARENNHLSRLSTGQVREALSNPPGQQVRDG